MKTKKDKKSAADDRDPTTHLPPPKDLYILAENNPKPQKWENKRKRQPNLSLPVGGSATDLTKNDS